MAVMNQKWRDIDNIIRMRDDRAIVGTIYIYRFVYFDSKVYAIAYTPSYETTTGHHSR